MYVTGKRPFLSFVLNMAQSDNAYLSKKGAEKWRQADPNRPFSLLSEQKITFLRRKRKFSPKKSSLASEEKNAHIRSCRPRRPYISNEVNAHARQRHRTCFPNNQNPLDFIIFPVVFCLRSQTSSKYHFILRPKDISEIRKTNNHKSNTKLAFTQNIEKTKNIRPHENRL